MSRLERLAAPVELPTSPSSTRMRGSPFASSARVSPKTSRSALPIASVIFHPPPGDRHRVGQLGERRCQLLVGGHPAVPAEVALHERDSLALDGVRDDDGRPAATCRWPPPAQLSDRRHVVAVNLADRPAECRPAVAQLRCRRRAADAGLVPSARQPNCCSSFWSTIDDQVVQRVALGDMRALPDDALVALAVAHHDEGREVPARASLAPSAMPTPAAKPRPSEPLDMSSPGSAVHVRVALQPGVDRIESGDLVQREVTAQRHHDVQGDASCGPWTG